VLLLLKLGKPFLVQSHILPNLSLFHDYSLHN
jgi:hypothetical protein